MSFRTRKYSTVLLLGLATVSCKKEDFRPLAAETQLNVAYGNDPQQKMDIYLPAGRNIEPAKVIILIHGGGWNQGDKADFFPYVDTLKRRLPGYAIFNVNYRLATGTSNLFPTQENDIRAAVGFIHARRGEFHLSEKYVVLGASAGAHLALLQAYKNNSPVAFSAVIDFFGPTDLAGLYNNPPNPLVPLLLAQVTGGSPATTPAVYQQSSPLNFVSAQVPPTIVLHGGADFVVPASQSQLLVNRLRQNGVSAQYVYYPSESHGWTGANLTDSFNKIAAFLNAHVN